VPAWRREREKGVHLSSVASSSSSLNQRHLEAGSRNSRCGESFAKHGRRGTTNTTRNACWQNKTSPQKPLADTNRNALHFPQGKNEASLMQGHRARGNRDFNAGCCPIAPSSGSLSPQGGPMQAATKQTLPGFLSRALKTCRHLALYALLLSRETLPCASPLLHYPAPTQSMGLRSSPLPFAPFSFCCLLVPQPTGGVGKHQLSALTTPPPTTHLHTQHTHTTHTDRARARRPGALYFCGTP